VVSLHYIQQERGDDNSQAPPDIEGKLEKLAKKAGKSKTHCVRQAVMYLLQDEEDATIAVSRMRKGRPSISLDKAARRLGLKNRD
jgi:predicted DNA-binding protein